MGNAAIIPQMEQLAHLLLEWIGFGTLVGLLAKGIMPGRDPGGAITTLAMGIGGTVIGLGTLTYFYPTQHVTPISLIGVAVGTAGAFLLLFFYRLLGGRWFSAGERRSHTRLLRPRRRSLRTDDYVGENRVIID